MTRALSLTLGFLATTAVVAPPADAFRTVGFGPKVTAPTVRYYTNVPGHLAEVRSAAAAWNRSGAKLRWMPSAPSRALVRITIDRRLGDGVAGLTVSRGRRASIFLNPVTIDDVADGPNELRYLYTLTAAHEMGHAIGLLHDARRCALMNPSNIRSRCAEPSDPRSFFRCRILEPDDIAGAVALRGGTARAPSGPTFCARD